MCLSSQIFTQRFLQCAAPAAVHVDDERQPLFTLGWRAIQTHPLPRGTRLYMRCGIQLNCSPILALHSMGSGLSENFFIFTAAAPTNSHSPPVGGWRAAICFPARWANGVGLRPSGSFPARAEANTRMIPSFKFVPVAQHQDF